MNTLRDADKGRAGPSVWPVYGVPFVLGGITVSFLTWVYLTSLQAYSYAEHPERLEQLSLGERTIVEAPVLWTTLCVAYAILALVATLGTALLRPWGWWCAVTWAGVCLLAELFLMLSISTHGDLLLNTLSSLSFLAYVAWSLATRRRLFFPSKPDGEE